MTELSVDRLFALELLADVAYDLEDRYGRPPKTLAVVAEAFAQAGYYVPGMDVSRRTVRTADVAARFDDARKHLDRRLLRAEGRGMLSTIDLLHAAGLVRNADTREAKRLRWLERGGHG